jgi:serine/threonine protein kinase
MPLKAQQKVGRYEVIRVIGQSNDIVYEAWDPAFSRRVAIKLLNIEKSDPDSPLDPREAKLVAERIERFKREAQALGALSHPNIMQVYDCGDIDESSYIVMELVEGSSIHSLLNSKGCLSTSEMQGVLTQVLAGLHYCHGKGVVHRDLKPANMQLSPDGTVKLLDFGIARMDWQPKLTQTGEVFGTAWYMSPEQCKGQSVDARSDLFSVGVIAYELLVGCPPFNGPSHFSVCQAIVNDNPDLSLFLHEPAVAEFLEKALAKDPSWRFQTAVDMHNALQRLGPCAAPLPTPVPVVRPTPAAPVSTAAPVGYPTPTPVPKKVVSAPSPDPKASALFKSILLVICVLILCLIFPGWRIWIAIACGIGATYAFEAKDHRRVMTLPLLLACFGILWFGYAGRHTKQVGNVRPKPETQASVARSLGTATNAAKSVQNGKAQIARQPKAQTSTNLVRLPNARKPNGAGRLPQANNTPRNRAPGPKNVSPKRPAPTDHPRLRGGSRLGDGGDSSQSSNDSPPPSRSGSKLGGDGE